MNVDADRVEETLSAAREREVYCTCLRPSGAAIGFQLGSKAAIEGGLFVKHQGGGAGIHHQFPRAALDRGDHYRTAIVGS